MADLSNKQLKDVNLKDLGLNKIPVDQRRGTKKDIAEFLINEIARFTADTKSPVQGESWKSTLDSSTPGGKRYIKEKGTNKANMRLDGDLMESLGWRSTADGVAVGIMDPALRPHADGHNHHTAASVRATPPRRRFIPGNDQQFRSTIISQVRDIIDLHADFIDPGLIVPTRRTPEVEAIEVQQVISRGFFKTGQTVAKKTQVTIKSLSNDRGVDALIRILNE